MNYQVIKLSNGEDIIAKVESIESGKFKLISPLKMSTISKITDKGVVESLGLSRWVQVYSEEDLLDEDFLEDWDEDNKVYH